MPEVRGLLDGEQRYANFVWGITNEDDDAAALYALKGNRQNEPPLSGSVITDATQAYDQVGNVAVTMQMNGKGAKIWEEMTGYASENQSQIAIVLDNIVYSAPGVSGRTYFRRKK